MYAHGLTFFGPLNILEGACLPIILCSAALVIVITEILDRSYRPQSQFFGVTACDELILTAN